MRIVSVGDQWKGLCAGRYLVGWLERSPEIAGMLRVTDHPEMLDALEDAFVDAVRQLRNLSPPRAVVETIALSRVSYR